MSHPERSLPTSLRVRRNRVQGRGPVRGNIIRARGSRCELGLSLAPIGLAQHAPLLYFPAAARALPAAIPEAASAAPRCPRRAGAEGAGTLTQSLSLSPTHALREQLCSCHGPACPHRRQCSPPHRPALSQGSTPRRRCALRSTAPPPR
eukprot:356534-Chlamydomonas_euryale.AAC.11